MGRSPHLERHVRGDLRGRAGRERRVLDGDSGGLAQRRGDLHRADVRLPQGRAGGLLRTLRAREVLAAGRRPAAHLPGGVRHAGGRTEARHHLAGRRVRHLHRLLTHRGPITPQKHVSSDYLGEIFGDDNSCATDYNITLRYVSDDPMNKVKVFLERASGGFQSVHNNQLFLPLKTDAGRKRILDFRWVKKGPVTIKVVARTQSKKTWVRTKAFSACKP